MSWRSVRVVTDTEREAVLAALFEAGAQGVHEDGAALTTHFPPDADVDAVLAAVRRAAPHARCEIGDTDATDWSIAWRDRLTAQRVGRLVVTPPWLEDQFSPEERVVIEPGMAFGTGDHPTTRGVIRLLQQYLHPGFVVADLGAGSAVLSIAAAKLGASRAFAIEYDSDAIANAEENVRRNDVSDIVHVFEGDARVFLPLVAPVDLIVANIISSVLVDLSQAMRAALRPDGCAILSGVLGEERETMLEVLQADGWRVLSEDTEEGWWSTAIATA